MIKVSNNIIIEEIEKELKKKVKNSRYKHVKAVQSFSKELIESYKINDKKIIENINIASLGHDLFRDNNEEYFLKKSKEFGIIPNSIEKKTPILLHGKIAAEYIRKKYKINSSVYKAIYFHTSGNISFDIIGKILIISDTLERNRDFEGVDKLRKIALSSLANGFYEVVKNRMKYAILKNLPILHETYILYNKLRGEENV